MEEVVRGNEIVSGSREHTQRKGETWCWSEEVKDLHTGAEIAAEGKEKKAPINHSYARPLPVPE